MKLTVFPLIFIGVLLNATAQILLKLGSGKINQFSFSWNNVVNIGSHIIFNPYIFSGLVCYAISVIVWIFALSRTDVSVAYPMISLGYVINAIAAYYLLGEHLSLMRITGIFIILSGVYLVARS